MGSIATGILGGMFLSSDGLYADRLMKMSIGKERAATLLASMAGVCKIVRLRQELAQEVREGCACS